MRIKVAEKNCARWWFAAMALPAIGMSSYAYGSTIPVFDPNNSSASGNHIVGTPPVVGSPFAMFPTIGTPAVPQTPISHTFNFPSGSKTGSTVATVGLSETDSATTTHLNFAGGTGVTQTDPNHAETASSVGLNFNAVWTIPQGTLWGPPLSGSFSVPIGAVVGAGGSASFNVNLRWELWINGSYVMDLRSQYIDSITFNTQGSYLTSMTAPTVAFSPNSVSVPDAQLDQIRMVGALFFTADNDDGPTLVEIPSGDYQNFPTLLTTDKNLDYVGFAGSDQIDGIAEPEPSVGFLFLGGGMFLVLRRKARRCIPCQ